jgi:sec-independent protein translocase protein TatA
MGSFSPIHWLLVIAVVLLVFGPTKLASVGKGLGEGIRNFKKGISGDDDKHAREEADDDGEDEEAAPKQLSARRDKASRPDKARPRKTT